MDVTARATGSKPMPATLLGDRLAAGAPRTWALALALVLFGTSLFALRLAAPPRFLANEWRLSAYVLDVVDNGRWFIQRDTLGEVASKPPILTWLSALAALPTGRVGLVALYWPTAASSVAIACVLLAAGRARFGWRAGLLAATAYLASGVTWEQMRTARYDGVLALAVTLGALAAWRGWRTGRGWTWFWVAGAIGTLVKGPLALVLSAAGLLAGLWERRTGAAGRLSAHPPGVALFAIITGGWLALAYLQAGPQLIDKMFAQELVAHAVGGVGDVPSTHLSQAYKPLVTLAIDFAPWSLIALVGAWRAVARPSDDAETRAFERFILLWLAADLLVFMLAAHHRARLIYPVMPAAALLAGRELARWTSRLQAAALLGATAALGLVLLAVASHPPGRPDRAERATVAANALARRLQALGPGEFPLTYAEPEGTLQVWLGTRRIVPPLDQTARLLTGPAPAFVVVESRSWADHALEHYAKEVFRWPDGPHPQGRILSNYPRLEWPARSAQIVDGLRVELDRARLLRAADAELAVRVEPGGAVDVVNQTRGERTVRLRLVRPGGPDEIAVRRLAPGAAWRLGAPAS